MRMLNRLLGRPSSATPTGSADPEHEHVSPEEAAAEMAVDLARDQLLAELSRADGDDVRALGFLAFDLAGAAVIIAARASLDRFWWAAAVGLGAAAALLVAALWRRPMETGPRPRDFYEQAQRESVDRQDVFLLALDLLTRARDHNRRVRAEKARWYTASLVTLIITVVGSGIYLWQVH